MELSNGTFHFLWDTGTLSLFILFCSELFSVIFHGLLFLKIVYTCMTDPCNACKFSRKRVNGRVRGLDAPKKTTKKPNGARRLVPAEVLFFPI